MLKYVKVWGFPNFASIIGCSRGERNSGTYTLFAQSSVQGLGCSDSIFTLSAYSLGDMPQMLLNRREK